MNAKNIGILIIIIGAIMVFYTGFNYVTTEKVVDIGPIEINKQQSHPVQWSPILGVVLIMGGVVLVVKDKK
ncbi:hypothetical protein [uncultured Flavobacterium sp.]|jgi:uncharacterized membrane protein YidH (DUF202 family)|uniref:hypothetical protein n=1 Tax=uncultured Flavobacterium sp. TaxID=165435 RepID=UPI0030EBA526|tara:strand:- start:1900 stop:2112 length:213 start_codon:yes stop_codon:yes gene_type:complete